MRTCYGHSSPSPSGSQGSRMGAMNVRYHHQCSAERMVRPLLPRGCFLLSPC